MQFGDKIRNLRQEKDLTQPELAERLNVEQSWLSKIETNKAMPSREFVQSVLNFFEVSLEDLLDDFEPEYVKSHLSAIPEVAGHLSVNRSKKRRQQKKWLIGSGIASVIGSALLAVAFFNVFFPDNQFRYISQGVLYFGEPNELYESSTMTFHQLGLEFRDLSYLETNLDKSKAEDRSLSNDEREGIRENILRNKMSLFASYILSRKDELSFKSNVDLGHYIVRDVDLHENAVNLFGEKAVAARRYYKKFGMNQPNVYQGITYLAGFLFLFSGLFGFFVEYRLSKLNG